MSAPRPYTLVAELTHRCPLACAYCSNPLDLVRRRGELDRESWLRVLEEAEALGVVQVHFSGGEPLLRPDLEALVARARSLGLYVNLVTGGGPLDRPRLERLRDAGVDHVQVSVQSTLEARAEAIAGRRSFAAKREALALIGALGLPLTLNVVLHRENIDEIDALVALAEEVGARRLELANVQFSGWALVNLAALLPSREAVERARRAAEAHRARLAGRLEILFVKPDYFGDRPKACMDGWARRFVIVAPDGRVLPCHAATSLPGLDFESVRARPLAAIWADSPAFNAFRGEAWMKEPCRSCPERGRDFAGCRCQAYALTGDARATDPACALAPRRGALARAHLAVLDADGRRLILRDRGFDFGSGRARMQRS